MLMTDDMAAGLALAVPGIPVEQRVDHGALPCTGTILLAAWPHEDIALERFRARLPGCEVTELSLPHRDGGRPCDRRPRVVRLAPAG